MTFSEISLASEIWFHTLDSGSGDCSSPWEGTQVWFGPVNEFNMQYSNNWIIQIENNSSLRFLPIFGFKDGQMAVSCCVRKLSSIRWIDCINKWKDIVTLGITGHLPNGVFHNGSLECM
jgi:hypothetical protein